MADTLPWMGPNATGLAAETPKPAFPNDASHWHSIGARPKASTPARNWSDVFHRRGKSSKRSNKRAPTLTPPPQLSLQNSSGIDPLSNLPGYLSLLFLSGRSYLLYFGYGSRIPGVQPAPTRSTQATPHLPAPSGFRQLTLAVDLTFIETSQSLPCL
ncbi:hypothetical protein SKAU_G00265660 [Synaphobranchus kaupii]|uniref:Uncharacterized protein n=1 Tax=Synaphobranchus kaupii TaxID=118154 RepID=A0A9Q1EZ91_SYNKA|nr:hypothetical protein SKAU_G00265660 [Synaphobranchus kaupii]